MKKKFLAVISVLLVLCFALPMGAAGLTVDAAPETQVGALPAEPEDFAALPPAVFVTRAVGGWVPTVDDVPMTAYHSEAREDGWYSGTLEICSVGWQFFGGVKLWAGVYEGWIYYRGPL